MGLRNFLCRLLGLGEESQLDGEKKATIPEDMEFVGVDWARGKEEREEHEPPFATNEEINNVLPNESVNGIHYKFSPSLAWFRDIAKRDPRGVRAIEHHEYRQSKCGTWEFSYYDDGITEQCSGCGEYRTRESK